MMTVVLNCWNMYKMHDVQVIIKALGPLVSSYKCKRKMMWVEPFCVCVLHGPSSPNYLSMFSAEIQSNTDLLIFNMSIENMSTVLVKCLIIEHF